MLSKLDLTPTQRASLEQSYGAVTEVLLKSSALKGILKKVHLRPQGSVRAGTVNRPVAETRFDLDVLCWLEFLSSHRKPSEVWGLVWAALGEHGVYREMREAKPRCIRLKFANGYDLDITPAIPDVSRPEPALWVPDKKLQMWSASNPIGFCDSWLRPISEKLPTTLICFANESTTKGATALNSRADRIEPLPTVEGFEKAPLLRLIQLVKHFRNEGYSNEEKERPSSILLTTITAKAYEKALAANHTSLNAFILQVVGTLKKEVLVNEINGVYRFYVMNPADDRHENFAEKWTLETYCKFSRWVDGLSSQVANFLNADSRGLDARIEVLNATIPGAKRVPVMEGLGEELRLRHDTGNLFLKGMPATAASYGFVRPTTFFGNP